MIKRISIILISIFLIILSYQIFNKDIDQLPNDSRIESYDVKDEKIIKDNELIDDKVKPKEKEISKKVSKKKNPLIKDKKKDTLNNDYKGFINQKNKKFNKDKYHFSNKKNEYWEKELRNRILDSLDDKPELTINKERSLIKISKNKAMYIEQAQIIINHDDGRQDSFRALIDPESGKIIRSWDRTIHENFFKKPRKFSPSGSL